MSYANLCSSKPLPPTCSRSLAARRSIFKSCSKRWSSRQQHYVGPIKLESSDRLARTQPITFRLARASLQAPNTMNILGLYHLLPDAAALSAEFFWKANPFIFRMFLLIRSTHYMKPQDWLAIAQASGCRCYEREVRLVFSSCNALPCGRTPIRRSNSQRRLPTRRSSRLKTCDYSTRCRPVLQSWQSHWKTYGQRKTGWCKRKSSRYSVN